MNYSNVGIGELTDALNNACIYGKMPQDKDDFEALVEEIRTRLTGTKTVKTTQIDKSCQNELKMLQNQYNDLKCQYDELMEKYEVLLAKQPKQLGRKPNPDHKKETYFKIQELKTTGMRDKDIIKSLNLSKATFYRYKNWNNFLAEEEERIYLNSKVSATQ